MITDEMIDAYMDGVDPAWRGLCDKSNEQFRGWVRNGLTAVCPLMVAAEREACALVAERDTDWTAFGNQNVQPWENGFDSIRDYRLGISTGRTIAAAIRSRNTSSEAGQRLGCASEGEANASSSDNPST